MNKYRLIPTTEAPSSSGGGTALLPQDSPLPRNRSPSPSDGWMDLIELFAPRLRHRVRLLLSHLRKGKIGRTEDNRIIYLEPTREEGSSLYDLVYFFMSPAPPNGHQARPPDALHFARLLREVGVPLYAYGAGKADFIEKITTSAPAVPVVKEEKNAKPVMAKHQWKRLY